MDYLKETNKFFLAGIFLTVILVMLAIFSYPGSKLIYLFFSASFLSLFFLGFSKNRIFFDTFLGGLMLLGFWSKLSFFLISGFRHTGEAVGHFDFSDAKFDKALLVASVGALGFVAVRLLRPLFFKYSNNPSPSPTPSSFDNLYLRNKRLILGIFTFLIILVGVSNIYLGIYQRGMLPERVLPFKLNSVYTWLLLFGLTSISSLLINIELKHLRKISLPLIFITIFELFFSNISILSRAMIVSFFALIFAVYLKSQIDKLKLQLKLIITTLLIFITFFGSSVYLTQHIRHSVFYNPDYTIKSRLDGFLLAANEKVRFYHGKQKFFEKVFQGLLINRWVGLEGTMAVSSYPNLSWDLFKESLNEKSIEEGTSFYDKKITQSHYVYNTKSRNRHITLPGVIGFFFYPGSYLFLFIATFLMGLIGAIIEIISFKLSARNMIFASLTSCVVAFRFAHFGFAPLRSYLIFGAIFLNIGLIWLAANIDQILNKFKQRQS